MKILSSRILLAGLLVLTLAATMMQPAQSFLTAQQSSPSSPQRYFPFQGAWGGTYGIPDNGQVLMYINAAGELFGSLASDDGLSFAQISGQQRNNTFHIVFTASSGIFDQNGHSSTEPTEIDATARWENSPNRFTVSGQGASHPYRYTFERLQQN